MALILLDDPLDSIKLELKTEPDRFGSGPGGSNRPPRRTALGYMGEDDDANNNMRKWQRMQLKILERGLQGYKIWLIATGDYAFLKTDLELEIGSTYDGQFLHWNKDGTATFVPTTVQKFEQQIEPQTFSLNDLLPFKEIASSGKLNIKSSPSSNRLQTLPEELDFELESFTDLLPPPLSISEFAPLDLIQHKLVDYLDWFKENAYTGIVKFKHQRFNACGALVLFRGRCTGAMFTTTEQREPLTTQQALPHLYRAMSLLGAQVVSYTLPEEIVLPISAAFLGYPVQKAKENCKEYFDYVLGGLKQNSSIAVVAITSKTGETYLVYVYQGNSVGFFSLERKTFYLDMQEVFEFVANNADIELQVSVLPNEIAQKSFQFGFELRL